MTQTDEQQYRIEHDTMGEVRVPIDALWRAQTQRAVENFPISGRPLERTQIRAMGLLKAACAQVNKDLGLLDGTLADAIVAAATEIAGRLLIGGYFLIMLWKNLTLYAWNVERMGANGVPLPQIVLPCGFVIQFVGAVMVTVGYR